jgi:hypothetical protein
VKKRPKATVHDMTTASARRGLLPWSFDIDVASGRWKLTVFRGLEPVDVIALAKAARSGRARCASSRSNCVEGPRVGARRSERESMKIFLASPVYGMLHPEFADSFIDTLDSMRERGYVVHRHRFAHSRGSAQLGLQRSTIAEHFLRSESEIMVQVDADQVWRPYEMMILAEAIGIGRAHIAGAAISIKDESCRPNVQLTVGTTRTKTVQGFKLREHTFVEVDRIGAGMIAFSRECVERVTASVGDPPRTPTRSGRTPIIFNWETVHHVFQSEEYTFERMAKEIGYKVHALSTSRVVHIGERAYVTKLDEQLERMGVTIDLGGDA